MKKLFMLAFCIGIIGGMACAQRASEQPQPAKKGQTVKHTPKYVDVDTSSERYKNYKAVVSEPYYCVKANTYFSLEWMGPQDPDNDNFSSGFLEAEEIDWVYGTGGYITLYGSGELGYSFDCGRGSYYETIGISTTHVFPYAVYTYIARAPSTSPAIRQYDSEGNVHYKGMPVYFKLYNSEKMCRQSVKASISGYGPEGFENVCYPADPDDYSAITETAYIGVPESPDGFRPGVEEMMMEFNGDITQFLGDQFGISIVFPVEVNEAGSEEDEDCGFTPETWRWNALPSIYRDGRSTVPHSVYSVIDWQKQVILENEDGTFIRQRVEGLLEDESVQPNSRYTVIPFDSWYKSDNISHPADEPFIAVLYTDEAAFCSANPVDKYVEVTYGPVSDYVNFRSSLQMQNMEIFTVTGKSVKKVYIGSEHYNLNVSNLSGGLYIARIRTPKGVAAKKFVVRR